MKSSPEQGFRTCLGIMRLLRGVDPTRAEWVAARAVEIGALNYKSIAGVSENEPAVLLLVIVEGEAIQSKPDLRCGRGHGLGV